MITITTKKLAEILDGQLLGDENITVENVSTDTRRQTQNGLFFALKGEKFDAHHYLNAAVEQGCIAVVVEHPCDIPVPQIVVADTRIALGQLGAWVKAEINPLTVAMTGSSGKTTVKEMTASILQQTAKNPESVLFTQGNFNNDIGVPLTLLRLEPTHQFAVIELGANHQNEIAYTTHLVRPNVALVNNVAPAHLEGFGSVEGVAQAKGEIYRGLTKDGVAILNLDCCYPEFWAAEIDERNVQTFSSTQPADYWAENVCLSEKGTTFLLHSPVGDIEIHLPYLGAHNVSNALAATALAMNVGTTLEQVKAGLEKRAQVKGRLFPIQVNEKLLLLDDTYNANVDSLKSAINVLKNYDAFRILAVGDIAELGVDTVSCHQQVADYAHAANLDCIASFGQFSEVISKGNHFTDKEKMAAFLTALIEEKLKENQSVVLLAKGSRSQKMEQVIELLTVHFKG